MKILSRYILRLLLFPFLLSLILLTFILLLGKLAELADMVIKRGVSAGDILSLLAYLLPSLLSYALPMALLISVLLVLSQLTHDKELLAIRSSGISLLPVLMPVLWLSFFVAILSLYINVNLAPLGLCKAGDIVQKITSGNPTALLQERVVLEDFPGYRVYIERIRASKIYGIHIWELPTSDSFPTRIWAKEGQILSSDPHTLTLILKYGVSEQINPENPDKYLRSYFKSRKISLPLALSKRERQKRPKEMTQSELARYIGEYSALSMNIFPYLVEFEKRLSLSFAPVAFALIALPLGIRMGGGRANALSIALGLILVYYALFLAFQNICQRGTISPRISLWLPNILIGSVGAFLTFREAQR